MEGRELFREALASTLGKVRFRIGELGSCATSLPLLLPAIEIPCTRHAGIERHTKVFRVECCRTCIAATDELGVQLTAMPGRKFENPEPKLAFCTVALGCDGKSLNTALSQHVPSKLAPWATDDPKPGNPPKSAKDLPWAQRISASCIDDDLRGERLCSSTLGGVGLRLRSSRRLSSSSSLWGLGFIG